MQQIILDTAIDAAIAAGALLRDDFHGVPDRDATKRAEIAAEQQIRQRLAAVSPTFGFRGEETGTQPPQNGERSWWLVDPLDGTSDHESGARSGAVSIAAVRDGVPVLGVVYAYAAPDDRGDLFAWAEGCGPLRRNGDAVEREPLPKALSASHVVLSSWSADRKTDANAAVVAPARFRGIPGIAYRLALVAAGEGDACASLNGPGAWDFAGGHALLRAVGGELVNEDGRPVRYREDGRATTHWCFGGSVEVAQRLASANWGQVLLPDGGPTAALDLAWPVRGESVRDAGVLNRAQGCLLGQIAGDNLGALVEFQPPGTILRAYPEGVRLLADGGIWDILAGQPTDDSELALALARSVLAQGRYVPDAAAAAYGSWLGSHPFDVGNTTRQALRQADGEAPARSARAAANVQSQANGSLMRLSPLAIFAHGMPADEIARLAREDSQITHPHAVCLDACAIFAVAVGHAVAHGGSPDDVYRLAVSRASTPETLSWLEDARHRPPQDFTDRQGWVRHALQNAFHQLLHAPSLEEGVVRTVMGGGDTDTNAAIAGALLGAVHGRDAVPAQWRRMVLSCHPAAGTRRPRPRTYWPCDAMVLAERLVLCGMAARTEARGQRQA